MAKTVIEVKETVRVWGYEYARYTSDYTIDEIKQLILEDEETYGYSIADGATKDEIFNSDITQWLSDNLIADSYGFEGEEVLDRDLDRINEYPITVIDGPALKTYTVVGFYEDTRQRYADTVEAEDPDKAELAVSDDVIVVAVFEGSVSTVDTYTYIGRNEADSTNEG